MTRPFPAPTIPADSRAEVFLRYLAYFRARLVSKLESLPPDELWCRNTRGTSASLMSSPSWPAASWASSQAACRGLCFSTGSKNSCGGIRLVDSNVARSASETAASVRPMAGVP